MQLWVKLTTTKVTTLYSDIPPKNVLDGRTETLHFIKESPSVSVNTPCEVVSCVHFPVQTSVIRTLNLCNHVTALGADRV